MNQTQTLCNGIVGVASSTMAIATTYLQDLELYIRMIGGILGIIIALITIVRFIIHTPDK